MAERSLWTADRHEEIGFDFQALLKESVRAMQQSDNNEGLEALAEAVPVVRNMLAS